jgi:hypothetical protein
MSITSTNYTDFSYIKEVTPGTTPTGGNFQRLPITSVGLSDSISTAVSEVIRSDRQTDELIVVDSEVAGDCNYELSYVPYKPLLVSLLQGGTATTVAIGPLTDIGVTSGTRIYDSATAAWVAAGIKVGCFVRFSGFTNPENNGVKKVEAVTATNLTVTDTGLVTEAAGASASCDSSYVRNGTSVMDTYTFKKNIGQAGTSIFYYSGCAINTMSFDFTTGSILAGSMGLIGRQTVAQSSDQYTETMVDVPAYDLMNSVSSIQSFDLTGLPAGTAFSSFNLSVDNQINAAKSIGVLGAADLAAFSLNVTADIEVYFEDLSIYNIYKAGTNFSVDVLLKDSSGNDLIISMPYCKFEELSEPVDGKDSFLMESGSLRALRDPTTNMMIQITMIDA